jgi:hypothetical protein
MQTLAFGTRPIAKTALIGQFSGIGRKVCHTKGA